MKYTYFISYGYMHEDGTIDLARIKLKRKRKIKTFAQIEEIENSIERTENVKCAVINNWIRLKK